ncbi:MAG TPA: multidrug DMT transporter permease [Ignavibacteria bacterium]|nr:multidrug DMT transporter permease [Ignavibacteria bacterium]
MDKGNFRAYLAYASICILWGTTYLAIRIGVSYLPPFLFAGLRWLSAGSLFLIFLLIKGKKFPKLIDLFHLAIVAISLIGIGNGLLTFAEQWVPSGISSLFITTVPFWMVGMELFLPSSPKLNIKIIIGSFMGLIGVTLILGHNWQQMIASSYLTGIIALFFLVLSWSFGSVYSKYKKIKVDPLLGAAIQMMIAGSAQIIVGLFLGEAARFHFNEESFMAFSYLLVFGSIVGYSSYIYALAHLPLSFVSTYAYINPVIALILGWLVLGEEMNLLIVLAAVVIFIGVAIVKSGTHQQKKELLKNTFTV